MQVALLFIPTLLAIFLAGAVAAGGDITPPVLADASANSWQLDTSQESQTLTITLWLTDDLSGLSYAHLSYVHEYGYNTYRGCDVWEHRPETLSAALECGVDFPKYTAEGVWRVFTILLVDQVGNRVEMRTADCEAWVNGRCLHYAYTDQASPLIRAMEIQIGAPEVDPPVYLPMLFAP